jgi:transposase
MAMGRGERERQKDLWVATALIAQGPGHPFYAAMNQVLAKAGFDKHVEGLCERFYVAGNGRPSVPPGVYFRMLLIGYFEGIDSERGIAWRCADSLALREFVGYGLERSTPDHSTLSVIRKRIDEATHQAVFDWVLRVLKDRGLGPVNE